MPYRIIESGIWVLKDGGDVLVEADWRRVLSFEGETATDPAKVNVGPSDAPAIFTKDVTTGAPKMNMIDPNGVSLPLLRTHSGVTVVAVATKDVRITFGIEFLKVPRISLLLDTQVTSQPFRVAVTKTYADVKFANNYAGSIDWTAVEPA